MNYFCMTSLKKSRFKVRNVLISCNNVALPYFYILIFTGGGLQFRRISAVAQKYFDALPCFSHDIHAMLFINCKYISINPNVPCLNVILTNSMQNFTF